MVTRVDGYDYPRVCQGEILRPVQGVGMTVDVSHEGALVVEYLEQNQLIERSLKK